MAVPSGADVGLLVIFLVQANNGSINGSAGSIASNFCNGATNTTPGSTPQIPNIDSSAVATCSGGGTNATIGTAIKGSILTMVASTGSQVLGVSDVEPVVSSQLNALPGGSSTGATTASSSSSTAAIIGGVVGVVVIAGIIVGVILMRRRQSGVAVAGAGAPAPGFGGPPPTGGGASTPNMGLQHLRSLRLNRPSPTWRLHPLLPTTPGAEVPIPVGHRLSTLPRLRQHMPTPLRGAPPAGTPRVATTRLCVTGTEPTSRVVDAGTAPRGSTLERKIADRVDRYRADLVNQYR